MSIKPTKAELLELAKASTKGAGDVGLLLLGKIKELEESKDTEIKVLKEEITGLKEKDNEARTDIEANRIARDMAIAIAEAKKDGKTPTNQELVDLMRPLIPAPIKGDKGDKHSDEEILILIQPLIPIVEDGRTPTPEELTELILQVMPAQVIETPESVRDKLQFLEGEERLDKSAIKGLDEFEEEVKNVVRSRPSIPGGRIQQFISEQPTGTIDGANDTFYLSAVPKPGSLLLVWEGKLQRPTSTTEYVLTNKKIVFNADSIPTGGAIWAFFSKF